jgi:hypothetical protein
MLVAGFCCHYVWAASHLQRNLLITSRISFVEVHLVMLLTVKVDLTEHSRMDHELSLQVGLNFKFVIETLHVSHNDSYLELNH